MERILNMILRTLINKGVNSGIKAASNIGNKNRKESPEAQKVNQEGQKGARGLR